MTVNLIVKMIKQEADKEYVLGFRTDDMICKAKESEKAVLIALRNDCFTRCDVLNEMVARITGDIAEMYPYLTLEDDELNEYIKKGIAPRKQ